MVDIAEVVASTALTQFVLDLSRQLKVRLTASAREKREKRREEKRKERG